MKKITPILIAITLLIVWSCREDFGLDSQNTESENFWKFTHKNISVAQILSDSITGNRHILPIVIQDLKNMKYTRKFQQSVKQLGIPLWDESTEFFDAKAVKTLMVPIADKQKESVNAILVVNYLNNYKLFKYSIVKRGIYPQPIGKNAGKRLMTKSEWDGLFSALEKELFGKGSSLGLYKAPKKGSANVKGYYYITTGWCQYAYIPSTGYTSPTSCTYQTELVWFPDDYDPNGGETNWGQGTSGGGGSSNNGGGSEAANQNYSNTTNEYEYTVTTEQPQVTQDLKSDCGSWEYVPVGPDQNYQAAGVTGIDFDIIHSYVDNAGEWAVGYSFGKFNGALYFEFPHKRADGTVISPGEAAQLSASIKDLAEEIMEEKYSNQAPLSRELSQLYFLNELRSLMALRGGRVASQPNYPDIPVNPIRKNLLSNGGCL